MPHRKGVGTGKQRKQLQESGKISSASLGVLSFPSLPRNEAPFRLAAKLLQGKGYALVIGGSEDRKAGRKGFPFP